MRTRGTLSRAPGHSSILSGLHRSWSVEVVRSVLSGNRLCRRVDRLEVAALFIGGLLAVAALPVAVLIGQEVQAHSLALADEQVTNRVQVTARLLEDPESVTMLPASAFSALVAWRGPDGRTAQDTVTVPVNSSRGSQVRLWVDARGRPTSAPLNPAQVEARAAAAVVGAQAAAVSLVLLALLGVRRILDRRRLRMWETEATTLLRVP